MRQKKTKQILSGKGILASKVGEKFAIVIMQAFFDYSQALASKTVHNVPAILFSSDEGSFVLVSEDGVEFVHSITTPMTILRGIVEEHHADHLWQILKVYAKAVAGKLTPALLIGDVEGEFFAIEYEDNDDFLLL